MMFNSTRPPALPFLLSIFCLFTGSVYSQSVKFDVSGTVTSLTYESNLVTGHGPWYKKIFRPRVYNRTIPAFGLDADHDAFDKKLKETIRKSLLEKVDATLKALDASLTPTSDLYNFLTGYYSPTDVTKLRTDLEALRRSLSDGTSLSAGTSFLDAAKSPLDNYLFTSSPKVDSVTAPQPGQGVFTIELWRADPLVRFVVEYYNSTITPDISKISLDKLAHCLQSYKTYAESANSLYKQYAAMTDKKLPNFELLRKITDFDRQLTTDDDYTFFQQDKYKKWFFSWIWFRAGELRMNPMDFTTDDYFKKFPENDPGRSKEMNDYFDLVINRIKTLDTFGTRLDTMRKFVALKESGNKEFNNKSNIQKLTDANKAAMEKQLRNYKLINKVQIPLKDPFFNYSATEDFSSDKNNEKYLTYTLTENETKRIALHNIGQGYTGGLLEEVTASPDQSALGKLLDTTGGLLTQLAALAVQFTPFAPLVNSPLTNFSNHNFSSSPLNNIASLPAPTFSRHIIRVLRAYKIYDEDFYESVKAQAAFSHFPFDASYDEDNQEHQNKVEAFLQAYRTALIAYMTQQGNLLSKDSLHLVFLQDLLQRATLPPAKLTPQPDKTPLYSSSILVTTAHTGSNTEKITPYLSKPKEDTIRLKSFQFERGRHFRFQLSAGIAYTTADIVQSSAQMENNKLTITNTAQQYRLSVGFHVHFGKGLVLKDDRFAGRFKERSSVYFGVGIPDPLGNLYVGYSYDFFPGLKTIMGLHFYKNNKYEIQNNVIVKDQLRYKTAFPFFAIQVDPAGLLKALNVIKPN